MSIRHYMNLVEALTAVPPTEGPTTTPEEEQTIDDSPEASEPEAIMPEPEQPIMPPVR